MKKLLVIALMAIMAIVVGFACSKNPTSSNSDSVGISVIKSNTFSDRTASNPTNPVPGSPYGPPYNADAGIGVVIGVFDVMSDVDIDVKQFALRDPSSGMEIGKIRENFKNMRLLARDDEFSALQLGRTIVNPDTTSYENFVFTLEDTPDGSRLILRAHKWVTISIIADVKNELLADIKMSGVEFYSVTTRDESGSVEWVNIIPLQTIYLTSMTNKG